MPQSRCGLTRICGLNRWWLGGDPRHSGGKGVVATANYVARAYGIHSAMPTAKALELCRKRYLRSLILISTGKSQTKFTSCFIVLPIKSEPVALDEAYLDVTENKRKLYDEVQLAHLLQQEIYEQTHLTSSVGISYNKFLAKLASDYNKPVGLTVIKPADVESFLFPLPIEKFRGGGAKNRFENARTGNLYRGRFICLLWLRVSRPFWQDWPLLLSMRTGNRRPACWMAATRYLRVAGTNFDSPLTTTEEVAAFLKASCKPASRKPRSQATSR